MVEKITLSSIVKDKGLQTGPFGSQLKANEYTDNGVPVVMPKDISEGKIVETSIVYTSEKKAAALKKHLLQEGDILFPRRGDLGRIGVASKENIGWICGTGCLRARIQDKISVPYIHQYVQLSQVKEWLESNALGQTMLNLNTKIIGALPIYLPHIQEQKRIANILESWDTTIEKTEALIRAKQQQFSWLRANIIRSAKNTTPAHFGDFLTESRIPDTLDDARKRLTVRLHLKGVDIRDYRGTESDGATQYFVRKAGQLVYGKQNIFRGSIGIIPKELDGYSSSQDIPAFDIADNVDAEWLFWYMSRPSFYEKLEHFSSGSGSKRLHPKELFKMPIKLPPLPEQQRIAHTLNTAQEEIRLLQQLAKKHRTQKRGLMQKLLTGEWRVGVDKEAAA